MLTEKERLEEELKLLKESLDLNVVTTEEFETAKQRIHAKLDELDALEQKKEEIEVKKEEEIKEEPMPEEKPVVEEESKLDDKTEEEKIEIKEVELKKYAEEEEAAKEEVIKEEVEREEEKEAEPEIKREEADEQIREEAAKEPEEEQRKLEEVRESEEKLTGILQTEEKPPVTIVEEKKGSKKIFMYIGIILILGFITGYFFFSGQDSSDVEILGNELLSFIACSSDNDCIKEGHIGTCNNPGEENAECEYVKDIEIKLMVLNNKNCFNCDTGRVLSILNGFFPNIDIDHVDFETEKGKEIAESFDIIALPAYILNSSLSESPNYYKFFNAFDKVSSEYVMKNTVANSNYYIERAEIMNKLDLFVQSGQSASSMVEENLQEFLEAFEGNVVFETHNTNSQIVKELGINSFPAFLVNNKVKFSGVQPADKIKDNFCEMNQHDECDLELSKSLV